MLSLLDEYVPVPPEGLAMRPEGVPANYDGVWSTGWCEDRDIVLDPANAKRR